MDSCYIFLVCVAGILVLYLVVELNYFLRTLVCVILASVCKKRVHILDETRISGICLTTDIDNLLDHMNNARYIRELDFAKIDFNLRTGLYQKIKSLGGTILLGATSIRYRRFIKIFSRYYITTRIIYWDDQNVYMEHRFITPSDNFINAIVMCKTRLIDCNANDIITELLTNYSKIDPEAAKRQKPEMSLELAKWIESNDISSVYLRSITDPKSITIV